MQRYVLLITSFNNGKQFVANSAYQNKAVDTDWLQNLFPFQDPDVLRPVFAFVEADEKFQRGQNNSHSLQW